MYEWCFINYYICGTQAHLTTWTKKELQLCQWDCLHSNGKPMVKEPYLFLHVHLSCRNGLFQRTPLRMTIDGVQWSGRVYVPGGCHLNVCRGGLEGIIGACLGGGGWNKIEACPGGIYKSVPGACPGVVLYIVPGGGYVCNYCHL